MFFSLVVREETDVVFVKSESNTNWKSVKGMRDTVCLKSFLYFDLNCFVDFHNFILFSMIYHMIYVYISTRE